jgi:DNA polymerase III subunit alpha
MQLHNHSQYSTIDGRGLISDYLHLAKDDGQEAFALTDHGTLGGIIDLYTQAKKIGIKPIAGMEMYVDAVELRERDFPGHLTVLAKNEAGYRALLAANNTAHRQFYYRPRVTLQQILDNHWAENWIILSGCMSSPIHHQDSFTASESICKALHRIAGEFYLEIMWHPSDDAQFNFKQDEYLNRVADLHRSTGFPIVITNDCHFAFPQDEEIYQGFLAKHPNAGKLEFDGDGFHFKKQEEMQIIADALGIPNAVANAVDISKRCNLVIPEADKVNWYVPDITGGQPERRLRELAAGRLSTASEAYKERFEYEMSVLTTSPAILNSYLVTKDLVDWCDSNGISVAARGSMAGSLVSHFLGITKEDPIKYGLSFNRAVNPARPSIPDFDLDVSSAHRQEILEYLKTRFAGNIPIVAYSHYGPKGALRQIMRMEGHWEQDSINAISKQLPDGWADGVITYNPTAKKYQGTDPWWDSVPEQHQSLVATYRGLYSSMSVHPSGVLVSGPERELEHEIPFQWIASSKALVSAFDMYTLKKIGLFKLDVLGLKTLDQLAYMERVSGERVPNDDYDDPEVLAAFGADLLAEIFQMDGYACRSVLKDIRGVKTFEDIIAANTLARPGCAQFTPYYRSGYEGLLREYPPIGEVLGPTNGLILYQEQVMEIARILADFDDAEQDDVKESIKYFRKENWSQTIEPLFRSRCQAKGFDATNILEAISRMASYTYNRAHAMTYAAIAYKMMWYKVHHPAVYYAAVFDQAGDRVRVILESHVFGVKWVPADINASQRETIVRGNEILLGLNAIKGVGGAAWETISKTRPYTSKEDMLAKVERKKCNKAVIESLTKAFALESIGEAGDPLFFEQAFGFNYNFLDPAGSLEACDWQDEAPNFRLGGFLIDVKVSNVKAMGQNHGKEMARARVVNKWASKNTVFFPDIWKKARGFMYPGAVVHLTGTYQVSGDFIVDGAVG